MQETNKDSALEMRFKQLKKYVTIGLVGVLLLSLLGTVYMGTLKQAASVSEQNQQTQAKVALDSDVCKVYPDQDICILAKQIRENPKEAVVPKDGLNGKDGSNGKNGADGSNGVDGRGVKNFVQKSGNLIVTYTDNQTQDLGRVIGKDGTNGTNGKNGTNGTNGATGATGKTGATGATGRGILAANVISGSLIISYTDGTSKDAGLIVGPKGDDGVSVKDINVNAQGAVSVTYSNGITSSAGQIILPTIEVLDCTNGVLTLKLTNQAAQTVAADCTPDKAENLPGMAGN